MDYQEIIALAKSMGTAVGDLRKQHDDSQKNYLALRDQVQELLQKGAPAAPGSFSDGGSVAITRAIEESPQFKQMQRGELKECRISLPASALKTAILSPTTPGAAALQNPDRASGIVASAMRRPTVRTLLPSLPTDAGATSYTRQATFTNAAAVQGAGSSPLQLDGELKPESAMTFELKTGPVATIAHWIPASVQVLNDMPALLRHIETWLVYGLALAEEDQLLNGNGAGGNLEGLITVAAAYSRGATADTKLDTLRKAVTQLALSEHVANGIVVNHADWEAIELLKDSEGRYIRVEVNGNAWQVPVVATNAMSEGSFLVGDFRAALVRDRQTATVEISNSHSDFFTRNLVAIRAELREALEIHRPLGFVRGAF